MDSPTQSSGPDASPRDTADLVARCLRGDAAAWSKLVQRYAGLVHSVPLRHGLSAMEVDDIGQEVFLALARHLDRIENPEALPAWLIITARRLSWRALQRRNREISLSPGATGDEGDTSPPAALRIPGMEQLLNGWHNQQAIETGLARLDERCRTLLQLLFLDSREPSYDVICGQMGIAVGSIGPTRARCLGKLRSILEGLGFGLP